MSKICLWLVLVFFEVNFSTVDLLRDDVRPRCKGELGNPAVGDGLRLRRRLNVCYCDPTLYRIDPEGCHMVCDIGVKSSSSSVECNCVQSLETCRKWLCRLGNGDESGLYCRTIDQSLVRCGHVGQSSPRDFDECQCSNSGWKDSHGFCQCPTNFYGPTCESELEDLTIRDVLRDGNTEQSLQYGVAGFGHELNDSNYQHLVPETGHVRRSERQSSRYDSRWSRWAEWAEWSKWVKWSKWISWTQRYETSLDKPEEKKPTWWDRNYVMVSVLLGIFGGAMVISGTCLCIRFYLKRAAYLQNGRPFYAVADSAKPNEPEAQPMIDLKRVMDLAKADEVATDFPPPPAYQPPLVGYRAANDHKMPS